MSDFLQFLIASVSVSVFLSGLLVWLFRTWISERLKNAIKHEYDQKLETHKAQLKSESDITVEHLKAQLQIAAAERNVRFSKVFEEIAETVAQTYAKLLAFHDSVGRYVSFIEWAGDPPKEERRKQAGEKLQEFLSYYKPRRLFLPADTVKLIEGFYKGLYDISINFMIGVERGADYSDKKSPDSDTWIKAHKYMTEEVPPLLEKLENDFRQILGTTSNKKDVERSG